MHAICELVTEEQHETMVVDLLGVAILGADVVVVQLAVAADRRTAGAGVGNGQRFDEIAGGLDARFGFLDLFVRGRHFLLRLAQLGAQRFDLGLLALNDGPHLLERRRRLLRECHT